MAKLYFYYAAMNAGKSTTLLQSDYNYRERGMRTLLFAPNLDNRYGEGLITSRLGIQAKATIFTPETDLLCEIIERHRKDSINCVLVDEAQFLKPAQVLQLTLVCDRLDIPVLCYGLRTDFRGEPFEGSKYLLSWAEELVEIKTVCFSGKKATMNARVDAQGRQVTEGEQVEIGHHYIALARREFGLEQVSPIEYELPSDLLEVSPQTSPEQDSAVDSLAEEIARRGD